MMNQIALMGRLTKDPELRYTNSNTPVASFTIAVDRDFQKDAVDFIDCVAWRKTGEFVGQYFRKGQLVAVTGSLQSRQWQDREGNKRTSWEVNVEHAYFGEARRADGPSRTPAPTGQYRAQEQGYGNPNVSAGGFDEMPGYGQGNPFVGGAQQGFDDGELPF